LKNCYCKISTIGRTIFFTLFWIFDLKRDVAYLQDKLYRKKFQSRKHHSEWEVTIASGAVRGSGVLVCMEWCQHLKLPSIVPRLFSIQRVSTSLKRQKYQPVITTAASQHVSAVWVNFKEVVYSDTVLQSGACPTLPRPSSEVRPISSPVQEQK